MLYDIRHVNAHILHTFACHAPNTRAGALRRPQGRFNDRKKEHMMRAQNARVRALLRVYALRACTFRIYVRLMSMRNVVLIKTEELSALRNDKRNMPLRCFRLFAKNGVV